MLALLTLGQQAHGSNGYRGRSTGSGYHKEGSRPRDGHCEEVRMSGETPVQEGKSFLLGKSLKISFQGTLRSTLSVKTSLQRCLGRFPEPLSEGSHLVVTQTPSLSHPWKSVNYPMATGHLSLT